MAGGLSGGKRNAQAKQHHSISGGTEMNAPANIDSATLHSIELEQEILGAVLVTNSALEIIEREVSAGDFFEPLHSEIFEAFGRVRDAHGTIKPALVIASIGGDAC